MAPYHPFCLSDLKVTGDISAPFDMPDNRCFDVLEFRLVETRCPRHPLMIQVELQQRTSHAVKTSRDCWFFNIFFTPSALGRDGRCPTPQSCLKLGRNEAYEFLDTQRQIIPKSRYGMAVTLTIK